MKTGRNFLLVAVIAPFLFSAGACGKSEEKKTVGEKIGGAVDKAVDQAGKVTEQAGETMKEAGEKVREAGEKMRKENK